MNGQKRVWCFREQTARLICLAGPSLVVLGFALLLADQINGAHWLFEILGFGALQSGVLWTALSLPFGGYWLLRVWPDISLRSLWIFIVIPGTLLGLAPMLILFSVAVFTGIAG